MKQRVVHCLEDVVERVADRVDMVSNQVVAIEKRPTPKSGLSMYPVKTTNRITAGGEVHTARGIGTRDANRCSPAG